MDLFEDPPNWEENLESLLAKYRGKKHPLDYQSTYQLLVMVILSAQDSDANINSIAPTLFAKYPNMESLAATNTEELYTYIGTVRNYRTKAEWLLEIANILKKDENIPMNMKDLVALKGIGRKSANVILRESNRPAEGIIADLHVIRVAPRIGLTREYKDGNKVEKELMQVFPKDIWGEIGMAISFLGREICRPKPKCHECIINPYCNYFLNLES
jgi:endonuclease-3